MAHKKKAHKEVQAWQAAVHECTHVAKSLASASKKAVAVASSATGRLVEAVTIHEIRKHPQVSGAHFPPAARTIEHLYHLKH